MLRTDETGLPVAEGEKMRKTAKDGLECVGIPAGVEGECCLAIMTSLSQL